MNWRDGWREGLLTLTACMALGIVGFRLGPVVGELFGRPVRSGHAYDAGRDPAIGSTIRLPARDIFGRAISISETVLLVAAGPCSECGRKNFNPASLVGGGFQSIIVIYDSEVFELPRELRMLQPRVRFVASSQLNRALNAAWYPRFYLVSSTCKLIAKQDRKDVIPAFMRFRA